MLLPLLLIGAFVLFGSDRSESVVADVRTENVRTFAKLYGYVRFFHPSDEAASIDWDRFAVHGVRSVLEAADADELLESLRALFGPIAPTVQLYQTADGPPLPSAALSPRDGADLEIVVWQHKGIGLGTSPAYESRRLNRVTTIAPRPSYAYLQQVLDAESYRGRPVRLRVTARTAAEGMGGQAYVWMSEQLGDGQAQIFGGPEPTTVESSEWSTYTIEGTVDRRADEIDLGASVTGTGSVWVDDFTFEVRRDDGDWEAISLSNASFERGRTGESPPDWEGEGSGYLLNTIEGGADGSGRAGSIAWTGEAQLVSEPLFEAHPKGGEVLGKPLGAGLSVQLPIALYSRDGHALGDVDESALSDLKAAIDAVDLDSLSSSDVATRMAGVVIAWNVLQHAYPYFDVVSVDWEAELTSALADAMDDSGPEDFHRTLSRMIARLEDGHGTVWHPFLERYAGLPVRPDIIEGQLVVVATGALSPVEIGDVILSIDGEPALDRIEEQAALRSGTARWRRHVVLRGFERASVDSSVVLTIRRDGEERDVAVPRTQTSLLLESRPPNVAEIQEGIFYVNLSRASIAEITARMIEMSAADGVIFDLRGYPNSNHQVVQHLTAEPLRSARWNIPQMIYPDREKLVGYDTTGRWTLPPQEPRIRGKAVFLTDESAISYAESVMGIVEAYQLAEIVGRPTAGTNGNINRIPLPGGYTVVFTGMRVLKHDGSRHHLVGIHPTIPVERTIAAVREGRDEFIERAVEVIRTSSRD